MTSFKTRKSDGQVFPTDKKTSRDSGNPSYVGIDKNQIENKTENKISKILYNPTKSQKHKEVLTIEIPQKKQKYFKFLKAYTKFKTTGVWKKIKDNNVQIEVEFYDSKDERYGKRLMALINQLNKEKIGEQVIYARTEPVEESTLSR